MKKILLLLSIIYVGQIHGQNWQWAKSGNGAKTDEGASVATDATGNVYATGYFSSPTDIFGNDTLTNTGGSQNFFLVKYDSTGNVLWARSGTASTEGTDVATDAFGNVYVTGFFFSSMAIFGTDTLFNGGGMGTGNFFLVKYNSVGNVVWAKTGSCASDVRGSGLSVDVHGNIYVTGFLLAPATFGTLTLSNAGVFVVKYNSSGTALWVKGGSVSGLYNSHAVATDHLGNVYTTGSFRNTNMTFGTTTLINAGSYDFYLVKYDSSGTQQWAIREGGSGDEEGFDIATDTSNNIYLTGYYFESTGLILGSFTLTNTGAENMLLVKYNSLGNVIWAKSAGGINTTNGYGVSTSTEQGVYVSGKLNSAIMFGSLPLSLPVGQCHSTCDPMFIVKYDTSGNALCASGLASGGDDYNDVATDAFGNAYIGADFLASPFIVGNDTLTLINPNSGITSENVFVAKWTANCQQASIQKLNNIEHINIYPNPTSDQFYIETNATDKLNVDLYDVNGRHVFSASVMDKTNINVSILNEGVYSMSIKTADRVINKKLVILR